jgi:hypothetical protein
MWWHIKNSQWLTITKITAHQNIVPQYFKKRMHMQKNLHCNLRNNFHCSWWLPTFDASGFLDSLNILVTFRSCFTTMVTMKIYPLMSQSQCFCYGGKELTWNPTHALRKKLHFWVLLLKTSNLCICAYLLSLLISEKKNMTDGYCELYI